MKKRFLSLFLTLSLTAVMIGCSNSSSSSEDTIDDSLAYEELTDSEEESTDDETEEKVTKEDKTDEPDVKENIEEENEVAIKEDVMDNLSGIILLRLDGSDYYTDKLSLFTIDLVTGATNEFTHFVVAQDYMINKNPEIYITIAEEWETGNRRHLFSSDFSKLAAVKFYITENIRHVGWVDTDGNFFDLTESVGDLPQSDFTDPRYFFSMGFTPDDVFQYCETFSPNWRSSKEQNVSMYYVTPDNLIQSIEGSPFENAYFYYRITEQWKDSIVWLKGYSFTDQIDKNHCLVDSLETSYIANTETRELSEYIPGTARKNWSGVVSPDGSQIAFLSMPKDNEELPNIYTTTVDGGEPIKVNCDIQLTRPESFVEFYLLDWR